LRTSEIRRTRVDLEGWWTQQLTMPRMSWMDGVKLKGRPQKEDEQKGKGIE